MAFINYYLDKPFDSSLPKEKIRQVIKECAVQKKHYSKSILSDRPTTLYLFFTYETRKRIKIKTNTKVLPAEWNFETGRYKSSAKGSMELNSELDTQANTLLRQYIKLKDENEYLEEEDIRELLLNQVQGITSTTKNTLAKARADFLVSKEQVLTEGTLKEYRTVFKSLDDWQVTERKRLGFGDFNQAFFNRYEKFLLAKSNGNGSADAPKKGLLNDTIAKYCATLKSFLQ